VRVEAVADQVGLRIGEMKIDGESGYRRKNSGSSGATQRVPKDSGAASSRGLAGDWRLPARSPRLLCVRVDLRGALGQRVDRSQSMRDAGRPVEETPAETLLQGV